MPNGKCALLYSYKCKHVKQHCSLKVM